jgi:hypothetical protein
VMRLKLTIITWTTLHQPTLWRLEFFKKSCWLLLRLGVGYIHNESLRYLL